MPGRKTDPLEALRQKLRALGFEILPADQPGRIFVRHHGCAAGLERKEEGGIEFFAPPGRIVAGELARLIDRGYQKFLKTADREVPAGAADLRALYEFNRELRYAAGAPVLYNQSLGSVSDRYIYDRVWHRDEGRQPKAWEETVKTHG